jgi:hypothetical protein
MRAVIRSARREDIPQYPPEAVRESVINALLHADYSTMRSSIQVAIFDDRMEITNPGPLPLGLNLEMALSGVSQLRNKVLGRVFREPKTVEGKLISSRNAIKHGFLAQNVLIKGERAKDLMEFQEAIYYDINPQGVIEELLVEKVIAAAWRWKRLVKVEGQIFDEEDMFDRGKGPQQAFNGSGEQLLTLMRYESNIEKSFYRALHELQRLQRMRLGHPVIAPMAIELNVEGPKGPEEFGFVS